MFEPLFRKRRNVTILLLWRVLRNAILTPAMGALVLILPGGTGFSAETIRVATYNIYFDNRNLDQVVANIREAKADIVALQETSPKSESYLKSKLRLVYPYTHFQGHRGTYGAERLGLLSKRPLQQVRFLPPQTGLFGVLAATFQSEGRAIQIANVHLQPVRLVQGANLATQLRAFSDSEEVRRQEIERVTQALRPGSPRIILGDFNSLSEGRAPAFLRAQGFVDTFASVTAEADRHPTWTSEFGTLPVRLRIDYIFHDPVGKTIQSQILTNTSSDHCLVVSEIQFTKSTDPAAKPLSR